MKCPHCDREVGNSQRDEITHMEHYHADIVRQRLEAIGEPYTPTLYDHARTAMEKLVADMAERGVTTTMPFDFGIPHVVEAMEQAINEYELQRRRMRY